MTRRGSGGVVVWSRIFCFLFLFRFVFFFAVFVSKNVRLTSLRASTPSSSLVKVWRYLQQQRWLDRQRRAHLRDGPVPPRPLLLLLSLSTSSSSKTKTTPAAVAHGGVEKEDGFRGRQLESERVGKRRRQHRRRGYPQERLRGRGRRGMRGSEQLKGRPAAVVARRRLRRPPAPSADADAGAGASCNSSSSSSSSSSASESTPDSWLRRCRTDRDGRGREKPARERSNDCRDVTPPILVVILVARRPHSEPREVPQQLLPHIRGPEQHPEV